AEGAMTGPSRHRLGFVLAALTFFAPMAAETQDQDGGACTKQADVYACRTEGYGSILNDDKAQARDEAMIDARRRALEQVAGVQVEAETITKNQALFDQLVRTSTKGIIQYDRVLEEAPTNDG